jgi:pimeloyl-ACP methyl ester carboxylesterase
VLTGSLSAPGAGYESEVTANWARRDFPELASRLEVPVEFSVAEHEAVWESGTEAVDAVAALFTASPAVRVNRVPGSGHNLSVGHTAGEYHARVLSFLTDCLTDGAGVAATKVEAG